MASSEGDSRKSEDYGRVKGKGTVPPRGSFEETYALASEGDANAQNNLGVLYATGRGVGQDDEEAARWYRLAADQKHAGGQGNLGLMYGAGRGVAKDLREAARWTRLAAEQGDAWAQNELGLMYLTGLGVSQHYAEAVTWFRRAAEQGFVAGQYDLGMMYANGHGVAKDLVQASMWLWVGACRASNDEDAERVLELFSSVRSQMTKRELTKADRLAHKWDAAHPTGPSVRFGLKEAENLVKRQLLKWLKGSPGPF